MNIKPLFDKVVVESAPVEETKEAPVEEVFEEEKKDETTEKTEE